MKWKTNAAGDLETIHNGNRYRAEQMHGHYWLYRKALEMSAFAEMLGRFDAIKDCEARILLVPPTATITQQRCVFVTVLR